MLKVKQIPERIGYYLAGFADGEGSFNVVLRKRDDYVTGWKVSVCFNVSQKDPVILSLFKRYLQCGTMRKRKDRIYYYEVNNFNAIVENVIPFFDKFNFLSAKKKKDYSKFKQIVEIMKKDQHLTIEGLQKIIAIRKKMNDGGKRKYEDIKLLAE